MYEYRIPGVRSFTFSRKPTAQEAAWLLAGYSVKDGDRYTLTAVPDGYASDDAVLARVRENIRHAKAKR